MLFKKIISQNRYVALETPSRPPTLHGKYHFFPFWLSAHLPYMQCRYGRCLKKMLDFVQKCRGGYRGCCSVQDWLADVFVIIKVFGRQNNTIPEKWKHFVPKRRFLMNINNNKRVFLCVIPVQSRERVAKAKAKNGHKFQNSASKLK